MKYNLTTLTEKQLRTNLYTGNPIEDESYNRLDDPFSYEELEQFEDDLFNERHLMSQKQFNKLLEEDQKL